MSAPKRSAIIIISFVLIGIIGWNIYQLYFVPKEYDGSMIFYNGTLFEYKNLVARKDEDTGLRLEYIGTVDSATPDTELPDTDFECNNKYFLNAKLYRDDYGRYYLYRSNGDLLMFETALQK